MLDAFLAIAHWWFLLAMAVTLGIEYALCRGAIDRSAVDRLALTDGLYGLSSALLILAGIGRVFSSAKGSLFYVHNPLFWVKMGLVLVMGLLSVRPTVTFVRWRKTLREGGFISGEQTAIMRHWINAELIVLGLVPVVAALVARGLRW